MKLDRSVKRQKLEEAITFFEKDAEGVQFLHSNTVVVSINIANYDIHSIPIDNESSADVLFYDAFSKMNVSSDRLGRLDFSLVGFIGDAISI